MQASLPDFDCSCSLKFGLHLQELELCVTRHTKKFKGLMAEITHFWDSKKEESDEMSLGIT